jgi:septin 7
MTDSYLSSRTTDAPPSANGLANGSGASPALGHHAISNVIRKKLMGYVGFANLPNQVHRKSVRKGFQFTVMVVGMSTLSSRF